jgi:hypothetical protein
VERLKKFLISFGGFLILLGTGGIINHISMAMKAVKEEQEMYGGSIHLMVIQMTGSTIGPYISCIIGGGIIIAIAFFLSEYQKRNDLTSELIQVLSQQRSSHHVPNKSETSTLQEISNDEIDATVTSSKSKIKSQINISANQDNERYYWKG